MLENKFKFKLKCRREEDCLLRLVLPRMGCEVRVGIPIAVAAPIPNPIAIREARTFRDASNGHRMGQEGNWGRVGMAMVAAERCTLPRGRAAGESARACASVRTAARTEADRAQDAMERTEEGHLLPLPPIRVLLHS